MKKVVKYDGTQTYMFPNGMIASPDVINQNYPAAAVFSHVIETDERGEVCWAIQNLSALRTLHKIDPSLSESEAISALEDIINAPPPEPVVSAEERIASALEFQMMAGMPDMEV